MGLLDDFKDKVKAEQVKQAERKEQRGSHELGHIKVDYVGGYDEQKRGSGTLRLFEKQVEFSSPLSSKPIVFQSSEVAAISIEGKDEVSRRISATRMLIPIIGITRLKKTAIKEAFVTINLVDGREVIFRNKELSPSEAKQKLINAISKYNQNMTSQSTTNNLRDNSDDETAKLEKLAALKQKGLITEQEYTAKKRQVLGL